jgi:pimeloyl-ACP methyl ester carboxylesterase
MVGPTASGYAELDDIRMYYEIDGRGYPLVLVHGGGSTITTSFGRIIPFLAKKYQVIAVELQAHGRTSDRNKDLSFCQDADDVAAILRELQISKAHFLGFSNGGDSVLQLALRHPEMVDKVAAASPLLQKHGAPAQFWEFMKHGSFEDMPKALKDEYLKITGDPQRLLNVALKCAKRMIEFKDMTDDEIRSIKAPVLLVNGNADVATNDHMLAIAKLIPNCQLAIFPGRHGEYMGEVTTLKPNVENKLPLLPVLEAFLDS